MSAVDTSRSEAPDHLRLSVSGDIDMATVDVLTTASGQLLAESPRRLVLDFAGVGLCDAAGLGALARIYVACRSAGCDLVLTNVNATVRWVLRIVGMEQLLTIEDEARNGGQG